MPALVSMALKTNNFTTTLPNQTNPNRKAKESDSTRRGAATLPRNPAENQPMPIGAVDVRLLRQPPVVDGGLLRFLPNGIPPEKLRKATRGLSKPNTSLD